MQNQLLVSRLINICNNSWDYFMIKSSKFPPIQVWKFENFHKKSVLRREH